MTYKYIDLNITKEGLAILTLRNGPLNVLNIATMKEINNALETLKKYSLKVLLINAKGKAFSAGVDISEHLGDKVTEMIETFHKIFENIDQLNLITVSSLQGAALGGGCELATYCDIVLASEKVKIGQPEITVGVFPPIAILTFPQQINYKKSFELIITGDIIKAEEAKTLGLINHVISHENLKKATDDLINKLLKKSGVVLNLTKKAFLERVNHKNKEKLTKIEDIYLNELMKTKDAEEGLKSFLQKRDPVWKNK